MDVAASNHQSVIMPVAQRGAENTCRWVCPNQNQNFQADATATSLPLERWSDSFSRTAIFADSRISCMHCISYPYNSALDPVPPLHPSLAPKSPSHALGSFNSTLSINR